MDHKNPQGSSVPQRRTGDTAAYDYLDDDPFTLVRPQSLNSTTIRDKVYDFCVRTAYEESGFVQSSGAILLYENLEELGFDCSLEASNSLTKITAKTRRYADIDSLVQCVEAILNEMVVAQHLFREDTPVSVASISTQYGYHDCSVTVAFAGA